MRGLKFFIKQLVLLTAIAFLCSGGIGSHGYAQEIEDVQEESFAAEPAEAAEPEEVTGLPLIETILGVDIARDALPDTIIPAQETLPVDGNAQKVLDKATIRLNFREASLDSILEYLSEVAGLAVVRETTVEGRITLMSRHPLTVAEAVELLNAALREKGYAAVAMGNTLKIVPLADAKKRGIPVRTGNNPEDIEPTDMVVTQIIPVRYLNVTQLKQDIAPLLPAYAELAANTSSNSLILTDTQANVRRVVEIIRALDTAVSAVSEIRVFQLQYANASNTAKLINEMFKVEQAAAPTGRESRVIQAAARFLGRGAAQPQNAAASTEGKPNVRVNASADERTNTLVVSGPPDTLKVVEGLVKELDSSPAEEQAVFVYSLQNAKAKNMETVLNNIFKSTTTGTAAPAASRTRRTTAQPAQATAAAAGLAGEVYVVADEDTNALMVMTASKNFERVREIISDLDRPVPQVLIKVLVAEVTHDKALDLGTEFSLLNLTSDGERSIFSRFGVDSLTSGLGIRLVEQDLSVTLAALQEVGRLDILSRPYILGSDNQAAQIMVGERVPFITSSRITEAGQTINTIQYQDIGIILNVTPHINPAGLVILDITPEVSALTGQTVPISDTVEAPVFAKRSATSRVAIQDGQTIVIGGLMEDQKRDTIRKVPLLGDIPLLGALFRRTKTEKSKTELLIFLTPHVASSPEMLQDISAAELGGTKIIPKSVEPGLFEKYMQDMK